MFSKKNPTKIEAEDEEMLEQDVDKKLASAGSLLRCGEPPKKKLKHEAKTDEKADIDACREKDDRGDTSNKNVAMNQEQGEDDEEIVVVPGGETMVADQWQNATSSAAAASSKIKKLGGRPKLPAKKPKVEVAE